MVPQDIMRRTQEAGGAASLAGSGGSTSHIGALWVNPSQSYKYGSSVPQSFSLATSAAQFCPNGLIEVTSSKSSLGVFVFHIVFGVAATVPASGLVGAG